MVIDGNIQFRGSKPQNTGARRQHRGRSQSLCLVVGPSEEMFAQCVRQDAELDSPVG